MLYNQIQGAQQTRTGKNSNPKNQVTERGLALEPAAATQLDERELRHLKEEQIAAKLFEQAPHDEFVNAGAEKESDERSGLLVDVHRADGGVVDVAQQEVMDRTVPVAGELVPGNAVPPVGVEATIGKVG